MAIQKNSMLEGEVVETVTGSPDPSAGSAGLQTQVPGSAATVTAAAEATGGIGAGNFIATDLDEELFRFNSDDTPLMNLMLMAKKVKVSSPEVEHYMIDEPQSVVKTNAALAATTTFQAELPLEAKDQNIPRPHTTLLVKGVSGYSADGQTKTAGKDLLLLVTGHSTTSGNPVVRAMNGPKSEPNDEYGTIPAIPAGSTCVILANALYETQKEIDPDLIVPKPSTIFLQKRGMNQVVSDYFDAQKKRIPFTKALIAEQTIANFKVKGNRTLWASRNGKIKVNVPKMGMQYLYTTEGVRWQFKRELVKKGGWKFEDFISLAKMYYTGEDVPKSALLLAGKNLLESIQCIDFSEHPEVQIAIKTNKLGWSVTSIHTVFGDIDIKREPTLDRLGWSNSGALIGEDRLVHYIYSQEHSFNENIEGEEAKRSGILIWDALALKGSCHLWIDGEGNTSSDSNVTKYVLWNNEQAPGAGDGLAEGVVYLLTKDCPGIDVAAVSGQTWWYKDNKWSIFTGDLFASA